MNIFGNGMRQYRDFECLNVGKFTTFKAFDSIAKYVLIVE